MRRFEDALLDLILREPARQGRIWMIVDDDRVGNPVKAIEVSARTGSMGDRRIFISPVEAACTVRTGEPDYDRSTESIAKKIIMLKSQYGRANARAVAAGRHAGSPSATACRATCLVGLSYEGQAAPIPIF